VKKPTFAASLTLALPVALSLATVACTTVQSADIKTAGMSAHMTVTADGSGGTEAVAQLNVDDNITDFVTLSTGDSLVTQVAGQSQTMSESDVLNDVSYSAAFSGQDAANTSYTIAFNRKSDTSAPTSTCTLPAGFSISAPAAGLSFSRASDVINVAYGAAGTGDIMQYSISGSCLNEAVSTSVGNGDPGTFSVAKGSLTLPSSNASSTATCQATLSITRKRVGQLDGAFGSGGEIDCIQSRQVTFTSTP
jgi:hypothetical protein